MLFEPICHDLLYSLCMNCQNSLNDSDTNGAGSSIISASRQSYMNSMTDTETSISDCCTRSGTVFVMND